MKKRIRKHSKHLIIAFIAGLVAVGIYSHLTNPFMRFTIVRDPNLISISPKGSFLVHKEYDPIVRTNWLAGRIGFMKSGWHIAANRISRTGSKPPYDIAATIAAIHADRFNPSRPYLISGDHFSVLYPRSLGIFYNTALDPRTALNETDWLHRQAMYLKTTALALEVFSATDTLSTTVVPISRKAYTLINVFAPPSDTLYSLLYALDSLSSTKSLENRYPFSSNSKYSLTTQSAAKELLQLHKKSLQRHWNSFFSQTYDTKTGFVKKDLRLSGTKDMAIRSSAFYDNIMVWSTNKLAQDLKIIPKDGKFLQEYKKRILKTYWRNDGLFAEDQDKYSHAYSSDWLSAYQTGFLSPSNPEDLQYLQQAVQYIRSKKIDRPFALKYHPDIRRGQLHLPVRLFAPDYGSRAIWSHWGMEYIKLLSHLSQVTGKSEYNTEAKFHIKAYEKNIKEYGGYPELYGNDGKFFKQRMYESVLETGWVVNFELASAMVKESE